MFRGCRLVTWNIGQRGLSQTLASTFSGSLANLVASLEADIVLLQETKLASRKPQPQMLVEGFTSFFCSTRNSSPYAGVGVLIRDALCLPVLGFEEGVTGALQAARVPGVGAGVRGGAGDAPTADDLHVAGHSFTALELDSDGRALLLDLGQFVLVCVYCPAGSDDAAKRAFRILFLKALGRRLRKLLAGGAKVLLAGDVNVSLTEKDTAFPLSDDSIPARAWLSGLLQVPSGGGGGGGAPLLCDAFRHFYPDAAGAYTCWQVASRSRETNTGSRIDMVLVSPELLPAAAGAGSAHITGCGREADAPGSDHCPVTLQLALPALGEGAAPPPPHPLSINAQLRAEGLQQTLGSFFQRSDAPNGSGAGGAPSAEPVGAAPAAAPPPPFPAAAGRKRPAPPPARTAGARGGAAAAKLPAAAAAGTLRAFFPSARKAGSGALCGEGDVVELLSDSDEPTGGAGSEGGAATWANSKLLKGTEAPLCRCEPAKKAMKQRSEKKGENYRRWFWACSAGGGARCGFFVWT